MEGTILILDPVVTNRIMLKVQLSAGYYHVVQGDRIAGTLETARRVRPDLILTSMTLPDGDAIALQQLLKTDETLGSVPILAVTQQNDRAARLRALEAGVDDVLSHPLDDLMLRARIRRLIRGRHADEELRPAVGLRVNGLQEEATVFTPASRVAVLAADPGTASRWQARLAPHLPLGVSVQVPSGVSALMQDRATTDAIVVGLARRGEGPGLRFLADLRARTRTRHAAILAITDQKDPALAADALDLGADDVMMSGFCAEELALRLDQQLRRKARVDQWRAGVRQELHAAIRDPMTGLYNRRYALPFLSRTARAAASKGESFAVLLADLDHFKRVNDTLGHAAGDAVIVETAQRLRAQMGPSDMLARVGGEEFMIVMPDTNAEQAERQAEALRAAVHSAPFELENGSASVPITISIGLTVTGPNEEPQGHAARGLMACADRALYAAKGAGRNTVNLVRGAA